MICVFVLGVIGLDWISDRFSLREEKILCKRSWQVSGGGAKSSFLI